MFFQVVDLKQADVVLVLRRGRALSRASVNTNADSRLRLILMIL